MKMRKRMTIKMPITVTTKTIAKIGTEAGQKQRPVKQMQAKSEKRLELVSKTWWAASKIESRMLPMSGRQRNESRLSPRMAAEKPSRYSQRTKRSFQYQVIIT